MPLEEGPSNQITAIITRIVIVITVITIAIIRNNESNKNNHNNNDNMMASGPKSHGRYSLVLGNS